MTHFLKKLQVLIFFISLPLFAQQSIKRAVIKYQGEINEKYVDSFLSEIKANKDMPMHVKQGVIDIYQNATPDIFHLNIKNDKAYYFYEESLDPLEGYNIGSKAGRNDYYTSLNDRAMIEGSPSLGYIKHNYLDWTVTGETKIVGAYKCYKAVANEHLYSRKGYYYDKKVVAWFTTSIPLNFGPGHYQGLPGLILQVERDKFTLTAIEITLNPNKEFIVKEVSNSKKIITEKESHRRIAQLQEDRS